MIFQDLENLGYHGVVFRCDNEPSILALLRAVKLAWTGDVVQETSAEGDPRSNSAAESSVNVVEGHVRSIKLAVESASGVEVPADHAKDYQTSDARLKLENDTALAMPCIEKDDNRGEPQAVTTSIDANER